MKRILIMSISILMLAISAVSVKTWKFSNSYSERISVGNNPRTGTEFAPNSSSVANSLIIYDTVHATHSYNASQKREVINIDYTNNYER